MKSCPAIRRLYVSISSSSSATKALGSLIQLSSCRDTEDKGQSNRLAGA